MSRDPLMAVLDGIARRDTYAPAIFCRTIYGWSVNANHRAPNAAETTRVLALIERTADS